MLIDILQVHLDEGHIIEFILDLEIRMKDGNGKADNVIFEYQDVQRIIKFLSEVKETED